MLTLLSYYHTVTSFICSIVYSILWVLKSLEIHYTTQSNKNSFFFAKENEMQQNAMKLVFNRTRTNQYTSTLVIFNRYKSGDCPVSNLKAYLDNVYIKNSSASLQTKVRPLTVKEFNFILKSILPVSDFNPKWL